MTLKAVTRSSGGGGGGGATINKISAVFTSNGSFATQIPAGAIITNALLTETAGHNVSVSLGTSSGGAHIFGATQVNASDDLPIPASALRLLAWTAAQTVYVASASWGGASVTATIWYFT